MVITANNLETYLTFNITKPKNENNIYPSENLQINDLSQNEYGSILLRNKQLKRFF